MTVSDNGPGVAGALQSKIFDQFFTTRPAGVGTGLGLNLCEQIINSHGGTIAVDHSHYPWWSPFLVLLPVQDAGDHYVTSLATLAWQGSGSFIVISMSHCEVMVVL
jgi:signal transduction histidine kinase